MGSYTGSVRLIECISGQLIEIQTARLHQDSSLRLVAPSYEDLQATHINELLQRPHGACKLAHVELLLKHLRRTFKWKQQKQPALYCHQSASCGSIGCTKTASPSKIRILSHTCVTTRRKKEQTRKEEKTKETRGMCCLTLFRGATAYTSLSSTPSNMPAASSYSLAAFSCGRGRSARGYKEKVGEGLKFGGRGRSTKD